MKRHTGGILAAYQHEDSVISAILSLKEKGYKGFTVYTPAPNHAVAEAIGHKVSWVRIWTLCGGLTGVTLGFLMTVWMSLDYPIVVGGKVIPSLIPYVVIAFELTILCGALATVAGLLFNIIVTRKAAAYDPRFTDDRIGLFVPCPAERRSAVQQLLESSGAEEVRVEA
ncbi:MAG TPA: DUF3341 domain-containing protein [Gemmatimonadales bacterium]|nr:DUF3341 domain-containing protein [Gemmatimonadales bacterium]